MSETSKYVNHGLAYCALVAFLVLVIPILVAVVPHTIMDILR